MMCHYQNIDTRLWLTHQMRVGAAFCTMAACLEAGGFCSSQILGYQGWGLPGPFKFSVHSHPVKRSFPRGCISMFGCSCPLGLHTHTQIIIIIKLLFLLLLYEYCCYLLFEINFVIITNANPGLLNPP